MASVGDLDTAERLTHETLALAAEKGNHYFSFSGTVYLLDTLAVISDDPRRAARLLGAVDELLRRAGHARDPHSDDRHRAALVRLRSELGSEEVDAALAEGRGMSLEEAIGYAQRGRGQRRRPSSGWESLTPTEVEVVKLVVDGLSNPQIAERLFVSRKTVTTHLTHVFAKLTVSSRAELSAEAVRHGIEQRD
jgi:DNA-binding CsgD family transcriptional regulator